MHIFKFPNEFYINQTFVTTYLGNIFIILQEALEFYDHPFNEHFDVTVPSYLPRVMILDYMKGDSFF